MEVIRKLSDCEGHGPSAQQNSTQWPVASSNTTKQHSSPFTSATIEYSSFASTSSQFTVVNPSASRWLFTHHTRSDCKARSSSRTCRGNSSSPMWPSCQHLPWLEPASVNFTICNCFCYSKHLFEWKYVFKVHLKPKIFFHLNYEAYVLEKFAAKFFDLVKSSIFCALSKPSCGWFATAHGESGES